MSVQLLTEHHLEFLSLKGGCTGSSESTLVKMPHCWKSRGVAHLFGVCMGYLLFTCYTNVCYTVYIIEACCSGSLAFKGSTGHDSDYNENTPLTCMTSLYLT